MNPRQLFRRFCLVFAVACALWTDVVNILLQMDRQSLGADFLVFWTAARAPLDVVYDFAAITAAQGVTNGAVRPFVSPPTMLLWMQPFAQLPFGVALAAWLAAGVGAWMIAVWRLVGARAALMMPIAPAMLLGAIPGQVTFLAGALAIFGVLARRPVLAGLCFGLAATMKPQLVLLVPLALGAAQAWRTLGWVVLTGAAVGCVSLLVHGALWWEWPRALHDFSAVTEAMVLNFNMSSPSGVAQAYGLAGPVRFLWVGGMAALGVAMVWQVFRETADPRLRVAALVTGFILCSPYAPTYETALLAPVAAALLLDRDARPMMWLSAALVFSTLGFGIALAVFAVVVMVAVRGSYGVASGAARQEAASIIEQGCSTHG